MIFTETKLPGAFLIKPELLEDERGFFSRTFCRREFEKNNLDPNLVQCSISFNKIKGTLRGLHYQQAPHAEVKLVRCTMGAVYDIIVDLRPESATFRKWTAVELTAENHLVLYVPKGMAHGFQTLYDHTEVFYQMSEFYQAESAVGVRWNDPAFDIRWPLEAMIISDKDKCYPDFT